MRSAIVSSLVVIMTVSGQMVLAFQPSYELLRYKDLEVLAKKAIIDEASRVNIELRDDNFQIPGYKKKYFEVLEKKLGKNQVKPRFLFHKCIMDKRSVAAVLNKDLDLDSDDVAPRIKSLADVRSKYGTQIWKMTSKMCILSQKRFEERLSEITSHGKPVTLEPNAVENLSKLVFYPTLYGKPTFKKSLYTELSYAVTASTFVGSTSAIFGAPFAGLVISLTIISGASLSFRDTMPRAEAKLHGLNMKEVDPERFVRIDFDNIETNLATGSAQSLASENL